MEEVEEADESCCAGVLVCRYPVESVATMRAIIEAAEQWQSHNAKILGSNLFQVICDSQVGRSEAQEGEQC